VRLAHLGKWQKTLLSLEFDGRMYIRDGSGRMYKGNAMSQANPDPGADRNGVPGNGSVADELKRLGENLQQCVEGLKSPQEGTALCKQVSERLLQIAEELKAREEAEEEMRENYPHFKEVVYELSRQHFERTLPPLPEGKDLETIAAEEGALPLEAFFPQMIERQKGLGNVG
jgi:hypothetical protein